MRKAQKQEILECLNSLRQAHKEILNALQKKDSTPTQRAQRMWNILKMLSECQKFAVSIGETIERLEGEGQKTVAYLEEYCELLYRIHEEISGGDIENDNIGNRSNENSISKVLKKQLTKIENSVRNDISIRKEIVFLPYKASMWDSMESIWMAAKEDKNCDSYVVAIPYYEKNPDGSLGQMHYEGNQYPDYVPITDWQAYKMEMRRPDAVIIHNSYDEWNFVTSIHPQFYSRNLKQYTELLVYIPYFILGKINVNDEKAMNNARHFCFLPGIISADRVILESETIRRIYIEEYKKNAELQGFPPGHTDREQLNRKFLALGSPKYDKIYREQESKIEIPQAWIKYFDRPDGSRKKIVLYNNSIAAFLQRDKEVLEKMEEILKTFKEFREDITLWWRPHPLIESTISVMRPMVRVKYQEMVQKYREEDWGIYDDTSNLDRAIVMADVYYGDWSSVVHLFRKTGKPIMIVNEIEWINAERQGKESVEDAKTKGQEES